jgi:hypothetical protein
MQAIRMSLRMKLENIAPLVLPMRPFLIVVDRIKSYFLMKKKCEHCKLLLKLKKFILLGIKKLMQVFNQNHKNYIQKQMLECNIDANQRMNPKKFNNFRYIKNYF